MRKFSLNLKQDQYQKIFFNKKSSFLPSKMIYFTGNLFKKLFCFLITLLSYVVAMMSLKDMTYASEFLNEVVV